MNATGEFIVIPPPPHTAIAVCKNVPEFAFTPPKSYGTVRYPRPPQAPAIYGPAIPAGLFPPARPEGVKRQVSPNEELHINLKTRFEPRTTGMLTPMNRAPAFDSMTFHDPHAELTWLIETQRQDIANFHEEMRANGFGSISLSQAPKSENDDLEAANIAMDDEVEDPLVEHNARRFGLAMKYSPDELAPILRQIDNERWSAENGTPLRIYAALGPNGTMNIASAYMKTPTLTEPPLMDSDTLNATYLRRMKALIAGRSRADIYHARNRAYHYGHLVYSLMTPDQQLVWDRRERRARAYLGIADDNTTRVYFAEADERDGLAQPHEEEPQTGGAQEIGFHGDGGEGLVVGNLTGWSRLDEYVVSTEPTEYDLWELTEAELATGVEPLPTFESIE